MFYYPWAFTFQLYFETEPLEEQAKVLSIVIILFP